MCSHDQHQHCRGWKQYVEVELICQSCGESGHSHQACPNRKCTICGSTEHEAPQCTEPRPAEYVDRDKLWQIYRVVEPFLPDDHPGFPDDPEEQVVYLAAVLNAADADKDMLTLALPLWNTDGTYGSAVQPDRAGSKANPYKSASDALARELDWSKRYRVAHAKESTVSAVSGGGRRDVYVRGYGKEPLRRFAFAPGQTLLKDDGQLNKMAVKLPPRPPPPRVQPAQPSKAAYREQAAAIAVEKQRDPSQLGWAQHERARADAERKMEGTLQTK